MKPDEACVKYKIEYACQIVDNGMLRFPLFWNTNRGTDGILWHRPVGC